MHKLAFILLIMCLVACEANTNNINSQKQNNEELAPTEISVDKATHNFGNLNAGEIVVHTFVLTNTGKNNFIIERVKTDCGCIKASFNSKPVNPGESTRIEVELNTAGLFGKEYKTIEILGNSKDLKHLAIFAQINNEQLEIKY